MQPTNTPTEALYADLLSEAALAEQHEENRQFAEEYEWLRTQAQIQVARKQRQAAIAALQAWIGRAVGLGEKQAPAEAPHPHAALRKSS